MLRDLTKKQYCDGTPLLWPNWGVRRPLERDGEPRAAIWIIENGNARDFFCGASLTCLFGSFYKEFIDGGAANEQRLKSRLRILVTTATRLDCRGEEASLRGLDVSEGAFGYRGHELRCLTRESEERETWTADVLADKSILSGMGCRERHSDGHVFKHRLICVVRRGLAVFGTRQE